MNNKEQIRNMHSPELYVYLFKGNLQNLKGLFSDTAFATGHQSRTSHLEALGKFLLVHKRYHCLSSYIESGEQKCHRRKLFPTEIACSQSK